jgi:NAD-dependent deacetylase
MAAERIVILTGAGVSAESGLGTFRDSGGVWTRHDLSAVATPAGFARDPVLVHEFYNARRIQAAAAEPNAAHRAIALLQQRMAADGGEAFLVTQNVDALHEAAGSRQVSHMHGRLDRARCQGCGHTLAARGPLSTADACPACGCAGTLRPDVVWFGEMPHDMEAIEGRLRSCSLFVSIGTSGEVYPAAGFVETARRFGAATLELNLEPSANAAVFEGGRYGLASAVVPAWVGDYLAGA